MHGLVRTLLNFHQLIRSTLVMSSMTQKVCDYAQSFQKKGIIGNLYIVNEKGKLQLFKRGQPIKKKHYGKYYWNYGLGDIRLEKVGTHKYMMCV